MIPSKGTAHFYIKYEIAAINWEKRGDICGGGCDQSGRILFSIGPFPQVDDFLRVSNPLPSHEDQLFERISDALTTRLQFDRSLKHEFPLIV